MFNQACNVEIDDQSVSVSKRCAITGQTFGVTVPLDRVIQWQNGMLIQDAFPELTDDERELLKSGTTPAEWHDMCCDDLED